MSNSTREILTLQVGHYANFVGTHWWNIQESNFTYDLNEKTRREVNHDVLFREGCTLHGDSTYTPRLVCLDLKGSLSTLKEDGVLYDDAGEDGVCWGGDVTLHKSERPHKNAFLRDLETDQAFDDEEMEKESDEARGDVIMKSSSSDYHLDSTVRVWSDYLGTHLHPKSVYTLKDFTHPTPDEPFDVFGLGLNIMAASNVREEIEDRLHFFIEECDQLGGIQLLAECGSAWGGVAERLLEQLADDYSSTAVLAVPVTPCTPPDSPPKTRLRRVVNAALCYERLLRDSACVLPLSLDSCISRRWRGCVALPLVEYSPQLDFHTSAILATSLDTATLPYRLMSSPTLLSHMTSALTPANHKLLSLHAALPVGLRRDGSIVDRLLGLGSAPPWVSLSPGITSSQAVHAQCVVFRGLGSALHPALSLPASLAHCRAPQDVIEHYLRDAYPSCPGATFSAASPLLLTPPFPRIFSPQVDKFGRVSETPRPPDVTLHSVDVMTSLQNGDESGAMLRSLHAEMKSVDLRRDRAFLEAGMEEDELKERAEALRVWAELWEGDSN